MTARPRRAPTSQPPVNRPQSSLTKEVLALVTQKFPRDPLSGEVHLFLGRGRSPGARPPDGGPQSTQ